MEVCIADLRKNLYNGDSDGIESNFKIEKIEAEVDGKSTAVLALTFENEDYEEIAS